MQTLRKITVAISQVLFAGIIILFSFFVAAAGPDVPDRKWYEKFPLWFLLLINIFSLLLVIGGVLAIVGVFIG